MGMFFPPSSVRRLGKRAILAAGMIARQFSTIRRRASMPGRP